MSVKTAFICLLDPWICPCCGMWKNFVKISSKRERKFFFFFFGVIFSSLYHKFK
jgi:hypothetical protein